MEIEEDQNNNMKKEEDKIIINLSNDDKDCPSSLQKNSNKNINNNIIIIENDDYNKENENENKIEIITKYSSLDPSLFLSEYISDYKCISCGLIPSFETSYEAICCGYLLCKECFQKLKEEKKGCPLCNNTEISTREIKKDNKIFYKSIKNFIVKCPYNCEWQGMWVDLYFHLNECKLGLRECKYKSIGCEYADTTNNVKEHEQNSDKLHLDLALKFIKDKKIVKKQIKFEMGETIMTTCHPHKMVYKKSLDWVCDGRKLEHGCYSVDCHFPITKPRFRCSECDFDLCDKCVVHYI